MTLKRVLQQWDGKSVDILEQAYARYHDDIVQVTPVVELLSDEQTSNGASWLLKRYIESSGEMSLAQSAHLWLLSTCWQDWPTCLHILQIFEYLPVSPDCLTVVERFLRRCLSSDNKFVRAWSYHGFYHLQRQYPQFCDEVKGFFRLAMSDESASVKARIRQIVKKYRFTTD